MLEHKKIKIAFFHLAFLYSGGGEKLALKQIALLKASGYQVDCYAPLVNTKECYPDTIEEYNVKEIIPHFTKLFHSRPEIGIIITCLLFPFLSFKFRKYDLIFGANQPGPLLGLIMKVLWKKPYIAYIAQPTRIIYQRPIDREVGLHIKKKMRILPHFVNIFRPIFYWIDLRSIASADKFLTNGLYMQEVLEQVYGKTPTVCSPGAKSYYEYEKRKGKEIQEKTVTFRNHTYTKPYIFLSNRHFPQKKFEYALHVLDQLPNKIPLLIAGKETPYTQELKKLVTYLRLNEYVHFLGYVNEKELEQLYKNCAAYLYTAPEEDFGMGVVEAMGYAKPVIAFNKAGPSRIITNTYNGFLAESGNIYQMTHYLENVLTNQVLAKRIGLNAAQTVKKEYSWGLHSKTLVTQIQTLTENTAHATQIDPTFAYQFE
jgi:glycosyltransferase involved in cell wall biosynthesis